jgi:nitrate/TMAO reductase-like tetraheme cytochrome c subunit
MTLPPLTHNRLSYIGAAIAAVAFMAIVFLFIINTLVGGGHAPYAGLIIFVALPAMLLFGLALVPVGMLIEWRHVRRTGARSIPRFPVIDLNLPSHRAAVAIFGIASIVLLFLSIFGSYQAYEATESVAFCGVTCHTPMEPEYVTYEHSPHARVRCVDCHVGPGADWYVKSKVSGLYQVYAVAFDKFPRPIVGPIESLRPAQETCEQCHWPQMFFGGQEKRLRRFLSDERNSPWELRLLVKTGGGRPPAGRGAGIHWHMNIENRVEYIATDAERQQIAWMRVTDNRTGQSTVYTATDTSLSKEQIAAAPVRVMDCMDCHNRPSHIFRSPSYLLDAALQAGEIDPTLPSVKQTGVQLLGATYGTVDAAMAAIEKNLAASYQEKYPEVARARRDDIARATRVLQVLYRRNFFPAMKARWDIYPDNTGHKIFRGCFRCHDGRHQSSDGKVVTASCTACHVIMAQGPPDALAFSTEPDGLPFHHPADVGDAWQFMACSDCHTGG